MLSYNCSFINSILTMERLDKISQDIASNQQVDDDIQMHKYEMNEYSMQKPEMPMNRHERRAAKAKYNKLNKRRKDKYL